MKNSNHFAAIPSVLVHQKSGNRKCSESKQINILCTQSWKPQANTGEIFNGLHWLHWSVIHKCLLTSFDKNIFWGKLSVKWSYAECRSVFVFFPLETGQICNRVIVNSLFFMNKQVSAQLSLLDNRVPMLYWATCFDLHYVIFRLLNLKRHTEKEYM